MVGNKLTTLMHKVFLLLHVFVIPCLLMGQDQTTFHKTYNSGKSHDMVYGVDDGFLMIGHTDDFGASEADVIAVKTDSMGNTKWSRTYGDTGKDVCYSMTTAWEGNGYIFAGTTQDSVLGKDDIFVVRIDSSGKVEWSKIYGDTSNDQAMAIQRTADSNYIIGGATQNYGGGDWDIYLIKIDAKGGVLWAQTYGKDREEKLTALEATSDSQYVWYGWSQDTNNHYQPILGKVNRTGDTMWVRHKFYMYQNSPVYPALTVNTKGEIFTTYSALGFEDVFQTISKFNKQGQRIWDREITINSGFLTLNHIAIEYINNRGLVFSNDKGLVMLNENGDFQWKSGVGKVSRQILPYQGGFVVTGGDKKFNLIKTDSFGRSSCNNIADVSPNSSVVSTSTSFYDLQIDTGVNTDTFTFIAQSVNISQDSICVPVELAIMEKNRRVNLQVYPNPFNRNTTIQYTLHRSNDVRLIVYDNKGQEIKTIVSLRQSPGSHKVNLSLTGCSAGIYYFRLIAGSKETNVKLLYLNRR